MKAVKTLVVFTILASFGVNANGYIIPHQPGTPEYDLMANGVMVNGEYQINGVAVPGVKVVDIGQMGYDLEQVITDMEKQKVTNQVILDDVGYVQNIAETANTNATEALRKVEDYKGIIDLNTSDITQIKHHLDTMTSVDVSGKAEQSDLTAVSDRVTSTEVSLTNINTEINNKADKADLDVKADKTELNAINDRLNNLSAVDVSNKADKAEVTAAISNAVADKVNQNQVDTSIAEAVAGKVDKTELVKVADTASKNTQMVNELNDLKADKSTVQDVADTVGGLQKTMLEKADKETVQNLSVAVSGKADKSDVDAAHSKADQINQILHGATSTMGTDSTGDIGLIAKVDKNTTDVQNVKTDIQVVSTQVSSIVDSVNQAATQAAEAKSQVDIATVKADVAQTTANTAYNMADTTQRQVAGFDGRITGVEQEVNGLNKSFSDLKAKVDRNEKKANAGIASVAALAGLPTVAGSKFSLGAATGGYSGEQAIAVGVNYNVSDRVAVKAGVSTTSATQVAYSTGIAVGF
ncbi:YadA C-terminal domain-containing protein [Citrobacter braakii]|uniref:YadA-like family protein n=2 Tax=Enterobacteriaceae TaxID=543 RepID=UPI0015E8F913|nr:MULTISPECIES: YadA C-terminal domain-containing protein [Citrobacter]MDE9657389.1 YadA C-terminal domain-containing protein [Citrobacter braakii]QLR24825.1 YadA-like family protein [Citrobacter sp. RHBSTW-01013]